MAGRYALSVCFLCMADMEQDQVWEMYSRPERRWVRVIVMKIEDGRVALRYEGLVELITVELEDMLTKREVFRPPAVSRPTRRRTRAIRTGRWWMAVAASASTRR